MGSTSSHSTTFIIAIEQIVRLTKQEASASVTGNCSLQALSIIPMLFSAFRCFVIECAYIPNTLNPDADLLKLLTMGNDVEEILDFFKVPSDLRKDVLLLNEIRNEMIHPSTLPTGTPNNWPEYLQEVKDKGLLEETGRKDSHFIMLDQMCSLRLIQWSCSIIRDVVLHIENFYSAQPLHHFTISGSVDNFVNLAELAGAGGMDE